MNKTKRYILTSAVLVLIGLTIIELFLLPLTLFIVVIWVLPLIFLTQKISSRYNVSQNRVDIGYTTLVICLYLFLYLRSNRTYNLKVRSKSCNYIVVLNCKGLNGKTIVTDTNGIAYTQYSVSDLDYGTRLRMSCDNSKIQDIHDYTFYRMITVDSIKLEVLGNARNWDKGSDHDFVLEKSKLINYDLLR